VTLVTFTAARVTRLRIIRPIGVDRLWGPLVETLDLPATLRASAPAIGSEGFSPLFGGLGREVPGSAAGRKGLATAKSVLVLRLVFSTQITLGKFAAGRNAELGIDVREVVFDRLYAHR
jgi:hypothetical protein